jgi:hypothetical protein
LTSLSGDGGELPQKPVYLIGTGESAETPMVSQMADFTSSRAFRVAGAKAFAEAGITHNDVDHLMIRASRHAPQKQASRARYVETTVGRLSCTID